MGRRWPALKKGRGRRAHHRLVDQPGFYLLPAVVRTHSPRGQTPVLRVYLKLDHVAAISGITLDGTLYFSTQERAFRSPDVVRFLRHLLHQAPALLLVKWGRCPIHRGQVVKDFVAKGMPNAYGSSSCQDMPPT